MLGQLVQKELKSYLLDFRFVVVLGMVMVLALLSIYSGTRNYTIRVREYRAVVENNRKNMATTMETQAFGTFMWTGYPWNRPPEVLSTIVHGLSSTTGQTVHVRHHRPVLFEGSPSETDPIYSLFDALDLAFVAKVILSLVVLLFVHDAVCGEKERGTLRLYCSFPVARSRLALAKLIGTSLAVLVPLLLSFLVAAALLALSESIALKTDDWLRILAIMGGLAFYLAVFVSFGLWFSALTPRRVVSFLGLMVLWTIWVFVVPNLGIWLSDRVWTVPSIYRIVLDDSVKRWEAKKAVAEEMKQFRAVNPRTAVDSEEAWKAYAAKGARAEFEAEERSDGVYHRAVQSLSTERRNTIQSRSLLAKLFASVSPLGAATFLTTDLARTGPTQQEHIEKAIADYLGPAGEYIRRKKLSKPWDYYRETDFSDFPLFHYQDRDTVFDVLSRNLFEILNLALLSVLGFAGAYSAILRYDVR